MDDEEKKKNIINRMSRLIGHAHANKKLIEEDTYCIDAINQNLAVISALHKVNEELLDNHMHTCVAAAMRNGRKAQQEKAIQEILAVYKKAKS